MKVLMPFYNIGDLDFYFPLAMSLAERGLETHIVYIRGAPLDAWKKHFIFYKLNFLELGGSKTMALFLSKEGVFRQLGAIDIDVMFVLSEMWTLGLCSYSSRKLKIPFVVWLRGDHRRIRELRGVNWFKRLIINYLEVSYLNHATFVVPNCLSLHEKLHKWGIQKEKITEPIHNGVDCKLFRSLDVPRSNKFTVGFAGRICPEKRIIEFLRIAKKLSDINFVIAGPKMMDVSFPENVQYVGKLPFSEMPRFYNIIDMLVLPSATEGFPSVILEAYACEKPVLVAKEAFPRELEIFGEVASLNEFQQKIRELQNSDLKTLGKKAREYVKKNFSWNQFGEKIKNYLEKAIKVYVK